MKIFFFFPGKQWLTFLAIFVFKNSKMFLHTVNQFSVFLLLILRQTYYKYFLENILPPSYI